jgi:hypothetical protein
MVWQQVYDPFHSMFVSTALAAVPVAVMLVGSVAENLTRVATTSLLLVREQ